MKRALLVGLLLAVLFVANSVGAPTAKAWGPCDGPYGGYAGCNYYGGNYGGKYGGYAGGFVYNRVCWWAGYGHLYCTYVRVPAYPASGYYGYYGSYYSMYGGGYGGY